MRIPFKKLAGYYRKLINKELVVAEGKKKKQADRVDMAKKDLESAKSHVESSKRQVKVYEDRLRAERKRLEEADKSLAELKKGSKKKKVLRGKG